MDPRTSASWEDLVTVALLGTGRRPVPDALPTQWAGLAPGPTADATRLVLGLAARHRAAVRAGSALPTGSSGPVGPPDDRKPGPPDGQQELADALQRGSAASVNDALVVLVDQDGLAAPEHWTALATLAAANPRVDRTLLAQAFGVRGVWFVSQNPDWTRLAAALRNRRTRAAT